MVLILYGRLQMRCGLLRLRPGLHGSWRLRVAGLGLCRATVVALPGFCPLATLKPELASVFLLSLERIDRRAVARNTLIGLKTVTVCVSVIV
jgi:hypothetical protein